MSAFLNCHFFNERKLFGTLFMGGLVLVFLFLLALPVVARTISDIEVAEVLTSEEGKQLHLNGAGVRKKFFFEIYIGALYLEHPSQEAKKVVSDAGAKRMVLHFLYDEVSREKLIDGWDDGFEKNSTAKQKATLQARINQFNNLFSTVKKGDTIILDYRPNSGTEVTIRGEKKGVVPGKDFNDALLLIWLGEEPVTEELKGALLNYSSNKHLR